MSAARETEAPQRQDAAINQLGVDNTAQLWILRKSYSPEGRIAAAAYLLPEGYVITRVPT